MLTMNLGPTRDVASDQRPVSHAEAFHQLLQSFILQLHHTDVCDFVHINSQHATKHNMYGHVTW